MKRFIAQLNDGNFINIPADSMKLLDCYITVYSGLTLVAFVDVSTVLCAHISDKGVQECKN